MIEEAIFSAMANLTTTELHEALAKGPRQFAQMIRKDWMPEERTYLVDSAGASEQGEVQERNRAAAAYEYRRLKPAQIQTLREAATILGMSAPEDLIETLKAT